MKKYTDRVGTRLRDLEIFVERATAIDDIDKFIEEVYKRSRIDVHPLMLNPALRKYFIALATETPVLYDSIPKNLKNIPEFSKAFYVNGLYVEFQNEVVKKIWIEEYRAQELGRLPTGGAQPFRQQPISKPSSSINSNNSNGTTLPSVDSILSYSNTGNSSISNSICSGTIGSSDSSSYLQSKRPRTFD